MPRKIDELLRELEQTNVYDSLHGKQPPPTNLSGTTIASFRISTLICPSDSPPEFLPGGTNYSGNGGVGYTPTGPVDNGAFGAELNSVTDGLSNTVAMSEWLRLPLNSQSREPRRAVYVTAQSLPNGNQLGAFVRACTDMDVLTAPLYSGGKGLLWNRDGFTNSLYNHIMVPNAHSCTNGGLIDQGAWTAASNHSGGVNTLFIDGHVVFVADTVSSSVWRAVGTRAGNEALGGQF